MNQEYMATRIAQQPVGSLACIALVNNAELGLFYVEIAAMLKQRYKSAIHLYCYNQQEVEFYRRHRNASIFTSISIIADPLRTASEPVHAAAEELAKAKAYESCIGCTYNTLMSYNRHFGRGFLLGGPGYPRSHYTNHVSYDQVLAAFNRGFAFWENEVAAKGITLFLSGDKFVARAAVLTQRPFRRLAGARFQNLYYWSHNEFFELDGLQERFAQIRPEGPATLVEPYYSHRVFSSHVAKRAGFAWLIYKIALRFARRIYWTMRGYEKARSAFVCDEVFQYIRQWRDHRLMISPLTKRLSEIPDDQPFIFFPLHTEPEASVQQLSPEHFYQHGAIVALARDLPAGVKLCVKETIYGTGRRPREFYRQISDLKNVIWLNLMEPGLEVVKRASAVATITGTSGFEAAVLGKPVISFGRHNLYGFLPHVFVVNDEINLKEFLRVIFSGGVDLERAKRDGARFLSAVVGCSFDLGQHSTVNRTGYTRQSVTAAVDHLAASLGNTAVSDMPA